MQQSFFEVECFQENVFPLKKRVREKESTYENVQPIKNTHSTISRNHEECVKAAQAKTETTNRWQWETMLPRGAVAWPNCKLTCHSMADRFYGTRRGRRPLFAARLQGRYYVISGTHLIRELVRPRARNCWCGSMRVSVRRLGDSEERRWSHGEREDVREKRRGHTPWQPPMRFGGDCTLRISRVNDSEAKRENKREKEKNIKLYHECSSMMFGRAANCIRQW